jgi:hypothetical protein
VTAYGDERGDADATGNPDLARFVIVKGETSVRAFHFDQITGFNVAGKLAV